MKYAISRSLFAIAAGLTAIAAHASVAPPTAQEAQILNMTKVNIYGSDITLMKYLQDGRVCQQFVQSVSKSESPTELSTHVKLDEICDVPELRKVAGGGEELFPKKMDSMLTTKGEGFIIQMPMLHGDKQ